MIKKTDNILRFSWNYSRWGPPNEFKKGVLQNVYFMYTALE